MNNSIENICLSLSEKGQLIKSNVARSIRDLHLQEYLPMSQIPHQKELSSKAKILLYGSLFCLSVGVILGVTSQSENKEQETIDIRIEHNNPKNNRNGLGVAAVLMDIVGTVGICTGTIITLRRKGTNSNDYQEKGVDCTICSSDLINAICSIKDACSKEWDDAVMEHTKRCKQFIDTMEYSEEEKIEKKEWVTTSTLIKYNSFEIQQLIDKASSTNSISVINEAVDTCSKKLQDAIDLAITQQISIYKNIMV